MPLRVFIILLILLLPGAGAFALQSKLTGDIGLQYGGQRIESGGSTVAESDYFSQHYSLLYTVSDKLINGRAGQYRLSLGYEWGALSTDSLVDGDESVDTGKLLYEGDLLLAPGGLPFRMHLYSKDMQSIRFIGGGDTGSLFENFRGDKMQPQSPIATFQNGTHNRTGANLVIGIRNGSYLGKYRDVLAQLPRFLIDYTEDTVKDLKSFTPRHYRDRDVAFISLNKKDNWLHYKYHEHRDMLDPDHDYDERQFLLGTIDYLNRRQWISLVNWLQISADGSQTTGIRPNLEGEAARDFDRWDFNLFAHARRPTWQGASHNSFSRKIEGATIQKKLTTPLYLNGEFSRDTAWRLGFEGNQDAVIDPSSGSTSQSDAVYVVGRLDLFRTGRAVLTPQFEADIKTGDRGKGESFRFTTEYHTNHDLRPKYNVYGSYSLARFGGTADTGFETDFWEHEAKGRVERRLSASWLLGVEQDLVFGSGDLDRTVSHQLQPRSDVGLGASSGSFDTLQGDTFRSQTKLYGEHTRRRLSNRAEFVYDVIDEPQDTKYQMALTHNLLYDKRPWRVVMTNRVGLGEEIAKLALFGGSVLDESPGSGTVAGDKMFSHYLLFAYAPSRALEATLGGELQWVDSDAGGGTHALVEQTLQYNFFRTNGIIRKLGDVGQELIYETLSGGESAAVLTLKGHYYPTKPTFIGTRLRYDLRPSDNYGTLTWLATVGANYEKMQVALEYGYGTRSAGDTVGDAQEHRWDVSIKKTF